MNTNMEVTHQFFNTQLLSLLHTRTYMDSSTRSGLSVLKIKQTKESSWRLAFQLRSLADD